MDRTTKTRKCFIQLLYSNRNIRTVILCASVRKSDRVSDIVQFSGDFGDCRLLGDFKNRTKFWRL